MGRNPIDGFVVTKADLSYVGHDLQRPECILAEQDGSLWSADARSGVMHIRPDGSQKLIAQEHFRNVETKTDEVTRFTEGTLPNGLAFARDGSIYIANFGTDCLELMMRDGKTRVLVDSVDGEPIGKVNFVLRDSRDRLWITVSTRSKNWMEALSPKVRDGYIAVYDRGTLRIVADNLAFTNEIRFDAREEWLYVVESCGPCITRFRVAVDGSLSNREIFGPRNHRAIVDGIAFDAYGNLWGTHIMCDRVFALTPEGELKIILDDDNPGPSSRLFEAFERGQATAELMFACGGTIAPWFTSVTFGGADLRNVYVGSLRGTRIPWFRSPVAGLPMVHWNDRR